jgi:hypothetical protein
MLLTAALLMGCQFPSPGSASPFQSHTVMQVWSDSPELLGSAKGAAARLERATGIRTEHSPGAYFSLRYMSSGTARMVRYDGFIWPGEVAFIRPGMSLEREQNVVLHELVHELGVEHVQHGAMSSTTDYFLTREDLLAICYWHECTRFKPESFR